MRNVINNVAQYEWFSKIDLRSAYDQVPILLEEKMFTAFEANGRLHQFTRIPFEWKNAVTYFHRVIDAVKPEHDCKDTFAYLDDITVCGKTLEEGDKNLKRFLEATSKCGLSSMTRNATTHKILLVSSVIQLRTGF